MKLALFAAVAAVEPQVTNGAWGITGIVVGVVALVPLVILAMAARRSVSQALENVDETSITSPLSFPSDIHPSLIAMLHSFGEPDECALAAAVVHASVSTSDDVPGFSYLWSDTRPAHVMLEQRAEMPSSNHAGDCSWNIDKSALELPASLHQKKLGLTKKAGVVYHSGDYTRYALNHDARYIAKVGRFKSSVRDAYGTSRLLAKNASHAGCYTVTILAIYLPFSLAYMVVTEQPIMSFVLLIATIVAAVLNQVAAKKLEGDGYLSLEGTRLCKGSANAKDWIGRFALGEEGTRLSEADLMRVASYAASLGMSAEFAQGIARRYGDDVQRMPAKLRLCAADPQREGAIPSQRFADDVMRAFEVAQEIQWQNVSGTVSAVAVGGAMRAVGSAASATSTTNKSKR